MAETIVCYLIDKLIPLLTDEVNLLRGVDKEVSEIKRELDSIRAFLEDADRKAEDDGDVTEGVKAWVKDLREVAFRIEDVVDEYTYHMTVQRPKRNRFGDFLPIQKPHRQIAAQIQEIKDTLQRIAARRERYGLIASQQTSTTARKRPDPRKASLFLKETEVIGLESPRDKLIEDLKSPSPHRLVASIFGRGGLGKTTLAKQVYDRIKGDFDRHAWIAVSKSDKIEDLLRNLIEKFGEEGQELRTRKPIEIMTEDELKILLREYLRQKRYLVIFDDVWNEEFWGGIEHALPEDESRGRILITTRKIAVAKNCKTSSRVVIHKMDDLPPHKAMELFCKKTFQEYEGHCPSELKDLSTEIVSQCEGLPLAIVVVAGLLSPKEKTVYQWQKFLNSLSSEVLNHSDMGRILSLSYNDLPYNLKCCYLYFGMFPKGYSIRCGRLIRQWIAGGFVIDERDKTLEDVAKGYLTELVDKSLVEIAKDGEGKARTCRVHDLLHDVISKKMEDLSFCQVFSGDESSNFNTVARRLSIIGSSNNILSTIDISRVRWFSIFSHDKMLHSTVSKFAASFKFLKELDFENFPHLDHLPEDIGNLFHLRYLSVRKTRVKCLPKSIEKLVNLETLDLKRSLIYEIPFEINNLLKLRHLFGSTLYMKENPLEKFRGMKVKGIGSSKSLQKLYYIEANNAEFDMCKELGPLMQLRTLGISKLRSEDGGSLCGCIEKMTHLESLFISSISEEDIIDLESMTCPPKFLRRLSLVGPLRKLPDWITKLQNLTKISIQCSKLGDDQLKVLSILPELVELQITHDALFVGEQLHFEDGGFPKLKTLKLSDLKRLNSLTIEEDALPVLEKLYFKAPKLQEIRIPRRRNLEIYLFTDIPIELMEGTDPNGGHNNWRVVGKKSEAFSANYMEGCSHARTEHSEI